MAEENDRRAKEREEIVMRVANFKATQEKFRRERDEFFCATLTRAYRGDTSLQTIVRALFGS